VREVQEETGLGEISLGDEMRTTYHTYRHEKKGRILKPTYWFKMYTQEKALTPQAEEQIELAEWVDIGRFLRSGKPVYPNIVLLLNDALKTA